jgi:hypothetical protein
MIILTALVHQGFVDLEISTNPVHFKGWNQVRGKDIYLLTNLKHDYLSDKVHRVIPYNRLCWNYVDKIHYAFKLSMDLNTDVLWVDFNKIWKFKEIIKHFKSSDKLLYYDVWKSFDNKYIDLDPMEVLQFGNWEPLKDYIHNHDIDPRELTIPMEEILYIPKGLITKDMIVELEKGDGIMSYISYLQRYPYRTLDGEFNIGNGEGFLLGVLLKLFDIPHDLFEVPYFDRRSGWIRDYHKHKKIKMN